MTKPTMIDIWAMLLECKTFIGQFTKMMPCDGQNPAWAHDLERRLGKVLDAGSDTRLIKMTGETEPLDDYQRGAAGECAAIRTIISRHADLLYDPVTDHMAFRYDGASAAAQKTVSKMLRKIVRDLEIREESLRKGAI